MGTSTDTPSAGARWRQWLHRFVPSNFHDIFGLAGRLLAQGKAAGRMAMVYSAAGLLLTPLDLLLSPWEKRRLNRAKAPQKPVILVGGPPRSGTTVVGQVLIKHLPVHYFNNLTSLFPRSPLTAGRLFGWLAPVDKDKMRFSSFYGRTSRLSAPNDALYFWDRWMGPDRSVVPEALTTEAKTAMKRFFGAVEERSGLPLVNKNNSLNTTAHLVAEALPTAFFVILDRDPLYLAQSHYVARQFIHGDAHVPYGIRGEADTAEDPLEDICRQVHFHQQALEHLRQNLGPDRLLVLPYEDFCRRPAYWVHHIAREVLGVELDLPGLEAALPPFPSANKMKIEPETFAALKKRLEHLHLQAN